MASAARKREVRAAGARANALATAKRLFTQSGYESVTIRDIAHACGSSTGLVLGYWASKELLFQEAMGRPLLTDDRGAHLLGALEGAGGAYAKWAAETVEKWRREDAQRYAPK